MPKKIVPANTDEATLKILKEKDLSSSPAIIQLLEKLPPEQIEALTFRSVPSGFENFMVAAAAFNIGEYMPALTILTTDARIAAEMVEETKSLAASYEEKHGEPLTFAVFMSADGKSESDFSRILQKATLKQPLPDRVTSSPDTFNYPTGRELSFLAEIVNNIEDLETIADRKKAVSRTMSYSYQEKKTTEKSKDGKETEIVTGKIINSSEKFGSLSLVFDDIHKFSSGKRVAQKMLPKALKAILAAPKIKGEPILDQIAIPIEDLVGGEHGYKSINAARQAFMDGFNLLSMIKIDLRNMSGSVTDAIIQFFSEPYIKDNIGYVSITSKAGVWPILLREYACIPSYFDDLSTTAQMLLIYIVTNARRNRQKFGAGKKNYIDISYRAIQEYLHLPSENRVKNKRRDIIDPIHKALKEIKTREARRVRRRKDPSPCIDFETVGVSKAYKKAGETIPVSELLQNGKVRVFLSGDLAEPLVGINEKQQKSIAAARRRKAKKKREEEKQLEDALKEEKPITSD